jgi:hypothetical protein
LPWMGSGGDPLAADAHAPWCPGSVLSITPKAPLQAGVLYRVRLRPTVLGWRGELLDTEAAGWAELEDPDDVHFGVEFTIAETIPSEEGDEPFEAAPTPTLGDLFAPGAVFDPERGSCGCHTDVGDLAHTLLDLRTAATAFESLVVPTRLRDTGFPMVTPRRPSESFLLQKLLRDDGGEAIHGVLGEPMPPERMIEYLDYVQIARWIEGGAAL